MPAHGRFLARGFHSLNQIEVKPNPGHCRAVAGNSNEKLVLNSSSPLNQVNDQHDDRNDEQEMDQTTANVTKQTKDPEHEQDNDYSPKHG